MELLHLLEFQWQLAWYLRCLDLGYRLIDVDHLIQQMFTFHIRISLSLTTLYWYMGKPSWNGSKKKVQGQRYSSRKKQPFQLNSNSRNNFVIKPLSNFDLMNWVKRLGIKHFRGIYSRNGLPHKIRKECGIINLDDIKGPGTHWVCYRNINNVVEYFDPFGLIMPNEALEYFRTSGKRIVYSMDEIQNRNTVLCGYWCLYYLFERQRSNSILNVIHNPYFDNDNSDFIKEYFGG